MKVYLVMKCLTTIEVAGREQSIVGAAPGLIGFMAIFDTFENATDFTGDGDVVTEISLGGLE